MNISRLFLLCVWSTLFSFSAHAQDFWDYLNSGKKFKYKDFVDAGNLYYQTHDTGKGTGYKQFKRLEYLLSLNVDDDGYVMMQEEIDATVEEYKLQRAMSASSNNRTAVVSNWSEVGPRTWYSSTGWNPGLGRLTNVSVHPTNANIIFVTSPGGGVWKSTDAGTTWNNTTDFMADLDFYAVCIAPSNTNYVYAGGSGKMYRSTDQGATWVSIRSTMGGDVRRIIVNPGNHLNVIVASTAGIYRSTDGGTSWTRTSTLSSEDIEFKPGDVNTVYMSRPSPGDFYRSIDNGVTFTLMFGGGPTAGRSHIAVTPANPSVVYYVQSKGSGYGYLYRSTDSGVNFTLQNEGADGAGNYFGYNTDGTSAGGQAWYDMGIAVSPVNADEVHIAGIICWKSTNGGVTFTATTQWSLGYNGQPNYNHADVHDLAYFGGVLYSTSDGGIYKTTNSGTSWTDLTKGAGIRQFYRIHVHRANPAIISGGAQDNGTSIRLANTSWIDWLGGDGMETFIDHTDPNYVYGTSQYGALYRSNNGGYNRTGIKPAAVTYDGNWVTPFIIDPVNSQTMYVGYRELYKSTNRGTNWTQISNTGSGSNMEIIEVAASNTNYIYIVYGSGVMYRTDNGGTSWTTITSGTVGTSVRGITVHPSNPLKVAVVTGGGRVYTSTNGGATWTAFSGTLPAIPGRDIKYVSVADGLYVGLDPGVYYRDNTATDWVPFMTNLPNVEITDLEVHETSNKIYAGTYGRGIWYSDLVSPLAIKVTNFTAAVENGNKVRVNWNAVVDETSEYFVLERSHDGVTFNPCYTVYGHSPGANIGYDYLDEEPFAGVNYYRLRLHEVDNVVRYTNSIAVNITDIPLSVLVAPNPSDQYFDVLVTTEANQDAHAQLFRSDGALVMESFIIPAGTYYRLGESLSPGAYILQLSAGSQKKSITLMKR